MVTVRIQQQENICVTCDTKRQALAMLTHQDTRQLHTS